MTPSRAESTVEEYGRRVDQIRRRTAAHFGYESPHLVPPLSLVEHLLGRKQASQELVAMKGIKGADKKRLEQLEKLAITRATWRQYKSALLFVLEEQRLSAIDVVEVEELDLAIRTLRYEPQSGCLKKSRKSSGNKMKSFPEADFKAITKYLQSHMGEDAHVRANTLLTWLRAGRLVGVRPSEWRSAGFVEVNGVRAIAIGNAKTTNGRGNGSVRTLLLDKATAEDIDNLDYMLEMLKEQAKVPGYDFDYEQIQLRHYMHYVTRRCLGKRPRYPTLYSLRHQFAADGKRSNFSQMEMAAMMGHGSDATASVHYGRKRAGQRGLAVSPAPGDVGTVRHSRKAIGESRPEVPG